ncbi:biotin--[acetyl-CoA-carboxylase] ligase [Microbacterium neungamense]|uniref:biotin--[acetyl-CoA-carboxylase] ligase n=1 Tax=Microbacterium neungamense TaxID=2810535 RepID=UPI00217E91C7|nr:biotin--[acetyl-CoA-carboxylase] ligase [Microbacterium neungamense]UWF78166.1 biotin--[acetyl-CoA-carboxylase] ligase [Microbacterium neungamense]
MTLSFPGASAVASRLEVLPESSSTNAALRTLAADREAWPHLSVLVTDNQTHGRGRLDRTWTTPPGTALAISVLLRVLPASADARGWLPLLAGLAMTEAVAAQLPGAAVGLKWPNDVLVGERKICGILAEATPDAVIIGSGVNTAMDAGQLPVGTATSFAVEGVDADPDRLLADYLRGLDGLLSALIAADDAEASGLRAMVSARCLTLGREVVVHLPGGAELRGTATRLEADGRLVVTGDGQERAIAAGDIVHLRPA